MKRAKRRVFRRSWESIASKAFRNRIEQLAKNITSNNSLFRRLTGSK